MKYHPDSGPLQYESAQALNDSMGDHMRSVYKDLTYRNVRMYLSMRRKAVLVSMQVARTWCAQYASASAALSVVVRMAASRVLKRPAAAASSQVLKRPAAAGSAAVKKRPAAADWEQSVSKLQAASASSAAGQDRVRITLQNAEDLDKEVGQRYRKEVSDFGMGLAHRDMQQRLKAWGYDAGQVAVRIWLGNYRLGDGAKYGSAAVYALSRRELQYWYYVQELRGQALVDKYRAEMGCLCP